MAIPGAPPQDVSTMRKQFFQGRREEAQRGVNAQAQDQNDAIQRRFTAMGAANSGANIAAMQKAQTGQADATRMANRDIDQGELQSMMASQEAQQGRDQANRMFDVEQGNKLKQLDLADKNYQLEKEAQAFNTQMAAAEAGKPPPKGMFDSIKQIPGIGTAMEVTNKLTSAIGLGGGK